MYKKKKICYNHILFEVVVLVNKINIKVRINNDENPYFYEGDAIDNHDLIEYRYLNEDFIFDKKIERITKININSTIIVDFLKKEIIIKSKENTFKMGIEIIKKEINEKKYYYIYKLNEKKIEFILEKEV